MQAEYGVLLQHYYSSEALTQNSLFVFASVILKKICLYFDKARNCFHDALKLLFYPQLL